MPRNTQTDKRYSVCIGINAYAPETKLAPLSCAENDAQKMDEMLGMLGFAPENRRLLLGKDATLAEVNKALREMILDQPQENDLIVFFFAGHGEPVAIETQPSQPPEVFLATYDFDRQTIKASLSYRALEALSMERLRKTFFETGRSRKRLFLLDSCYSGAFSGPNHRGGDEGIRGHIQAMLDSQSTGRLAISSSLYYQKAVESLKLGHGIFTYHILQALNGQASRAARNDGNVTAGSLFEYLAEELPPEQRPTLSGSQQDIFDLAYFPQFDTLHAKTALDQATVEAKEQLEEKWIEQSDIIEDRLGRFVGREAELNKLREQIAGQMERGGYVLVTGDAGQGKSSIIAKMIEQQGIDATAYHFVPANPGKDYQILILRSLMSRLLQKYDLPAHYAKGESDPILRSYFRKMLQEISEKQAREVLFLDGIDQLESDALNRRDLSFLPERLPPGIVVIVGTRPNKTLEQLQNFPDMAEPYPLPGLSHEDFNLLLQQHKVHLRSATIGRLLSEKLKQNPLYLSLVVRELVEQPGLLTEELITRIENNPDNIFGLTFSRLQRLSDWNEIIRPMLGTLLVAQEPLAGSQMAHILDKEEVRIRSGATHLGGLLARSSQQKYTLFHSKLSDYLRSEQEEPDNDIQFSSREVEGLHGRIVRWCEQGPLEQIWEPIAAPMSSDDYQEYARRHFITHLYDSANYPHLFQILDTGNYEREKLRADRSTRSSVADLLLGCQAAARLARTFDNGKDQLTALWRYTLLRASLTTRADAYPVEAFQALLALGKEHEASGLMELLTQPEKKLAVLIVITRYLLAQPERVAEGLQLYSRTYETATTIAQSQIKTDALRELTTVLIQSRHLAQAEEVAQELQASLRISEALAEVSAAYGQQQDWQRAEEVAHVIEGDEAQLIRALSKLAAQRQRAAETGEAQQLWQEASMRISSLSDGLARNTALARLAHAFLQAREWTKANEIVDLLAEKLEKVRIWSQMVLALIQEGLREQADTVWDNIRTMANAIGDTYERDQAQQIYASTLAEAEIFPAAETTARNNITYPAYKVPAFACIASSYIKRGLWDQSQEMVNLIKREYRYSDVEVAELDTLLVSLAVQFAKVQQWQQAKGIVSAIARKEAQCKALIGIAIEFARVGIRNEAENTWNEARAMCIAQTSDFQASVVSVLVTVQAADGQVEQARDKIEALPDNEAKEHVMEKLAQALAAGGQIAETKKMADESTNQRVRLNIVQGIAIAQMQTGLTDQAIETAKSISQEERQSNVLSQLVAISCQTRQWDLAQNIASQITPGQIQDEALECISVELARARNAAEARKTVNQIQNPFRKARALGELVIALAQIDDLRLANQYANNIQNARIKGKAICAISLTGMFGAALAESDALKIEASEEREDALCSVANAYARDHWWEDAERTAGEISAERKQDEAWGAIAREYANAGQWERAISLFERIKNGQQRKAVLQTWGTLLAQSANPTLSEEIVNHLSLSKEKANLLVSMANTLAPAVSDLELIHLIQRSWLQANTKDDCQYLFAMVLPLLLRNPQMCASFYDSFGWVDRFIE